jgi:exopolysaccharide biosynthesis polyprenyl glycosylphosphotransferase
VQILDVERVIVAFSNDSHEEMLDLIRSLKDLDIQIDLVPRFFEVIGTNVGIHTAEGLPLIGLPALRLSHSSVVVKRAMDLALSTLGLVLLAPLFAFVAVWIKVDSKGPVFFRQLRMGCGNQTFEILKFRTMAVDAEERKHEYAGLNKHNCDEGDARMFKIPDDPRVTRIGAWLRRLSIDELPQLINVLNGEMSLVGPRPLPVRDYQRLEGWHRKRYNVLPGITGLWQISGRSSLTFDDLVRLDFYYIENWSIWLDISILVKTLPAVIAGRGAY